MTAAPFAYVCPWTEPRTDCEGGKNWLKCFLVMKGHPSSELHLRGRLPAPLSSWTHRFACFWGCCFKLNRTRTLLLWWSSSTTCSSTCVFYPTVWMHVNSAWHLTLKFSQNSLFFSHTLNWSFYRSSMRYLGNQHVLWLSRVNPVQWPTEIQ